MIRRLPIVILLFTFASGKAQVNLVLNPGFEEHSQCPNNGDQINYANFWSSTDSFGTNGCNAEYLHVCGTSSVSVPNNNLGYQYPRAGNGMATAYMYNVVQIPYMRDYILGRLNSALVAGKSYCVSFYVSFAEHTGYFIDKIGAYLDDGSICTANNCYPLTQFTPQIENTSGVITDTLNWVKIEGAFTANGTERFITLGNFYDEANTTAVPSFAVGSDVSYYFIDNVSVVESDLPAYAGPDVWVAEGDSIFIGRPPEVGLECYWYVNGNVVDSGGGIYVQPDTTTTYVVQQTLCGLVKTDTVTVSVFPVSVNGITNSRQLSVYPNPASNVLYVVQERVVFLEAAIINNVGQQVGRFYLEGNSSSLDISSLPAGVYYLQLSGERGREIRSFVKW